MKKSISDAIICIMLYVMLAAFAVQFPAVPDAARAYPLFMWVASALVTTALFVGAVRKIKAEEQPNASQKEGFIAMFKMIAFYCVLMAAYIFLIEKISYIAASVLFILISLLILRVKSKLTLVLLPLVMTLGVYFIFTRFLMVSLPTGTWFYIVL